MFDIIGAQDSRAGGSEISVLVSTAPFDRTLHTENWIREGAESSIGHPVSSKQFRTFRDAGLLPLPDSDGLYPAWAAQALIRIWDVGKSVRSVPRRVVLLRRDWFLFPVPPDLVRAAMVEVIPSIERPMRKIARVGTALASLGGRMAGQTPTATARARRTLPAHPDGWLALLDATEPGNEYVGHRFDSGVTGWYMWSALLGSVSSSPNGPVIPPEEQVVMVALIDLASAARYAAWARGSGG